MKKFLREHLQLMELLICVLFFMAGSLMAGTLFIRAAQIQQASQELQAAVFVAQEQVEKIRVSNEINNEVYYFDNEWMPCDDSEQAYQMRIEEISKHTVTITIYRINDLHTELIYTLKAGGRL